MGPAASILLKNSFTENDIKKLDDYLQVIGENIKFGSDAEYRSKMAYPQLERMFWIKSDCLVKRQKNEGNCAFSINFEDWKNYYGISEEEIKKQLGYIPKQEMILSAGCNGEIDHQLLAHLILELAQKFDGFIDMHGDIKMQPFKGKVVALEYTAMAGNKAICYLLDKEYFSNRVKNGNFWMIK